jgi:ParB-like chromosome segregation protein Spo0J
LTANNNVSDSSDNSHNITGKPTIKLNEEYSCIIPPISESEYKTIKESIKDDGQHVPIITNQKCEILDGHTRFKACLELGIEPITIMRREFEDPLLAKQFIIKINRNRRQLTPFQRIELQYKLEPIEAELAKKRQTELAGTRPHKKDSVSANPTLGQKHTKVERQGGGRVIDIAAAKAHVGSTTYRNGRELIKKELPEELLKKLRSGDIPINKVYNQIQREEKSQQRLLEAKNSNNIIPQGFRLFLGDFVEQSKQILDNSVDMVYVDPPYNEKWLPNYDELAKVAARVLRDGGNILTYCNQNLKQQIIDFMKSRGLTYWWELAVIHEGPFDKLFPKQVIVTWKPLLLFVKGSKLGASEFIKDSVQSQHPDKTLNDWAQSTVEAEYYISKLTLPNDIVLDPTMGSGTTGIAALNQKRQFVGIEIVPDVFTKTRARIANTAAAVKKVAA